MVRVVSGGNYTPFTSYIFAGAPPSAYDADGDGIGDTPHPISGGYNEDRYPLMQPWNGTSLSVDAYEPDDTYLQANWIATDGAHQTHTFDPAGDHDWVKFSAVAGTEYTIETSNLSINSDTILYLYDTDGTTEITYDDNSGAGSASKIIRITPTDDTYYVMTRHSNSVAHGGTTRYNISITSRIPCTYTVCSSGCDHTSIQAAIDAACAGDVIEVHGGTYYENVVVNKRLTLRGIGLPVVNAIGSGSAITITVDHCTVEGFYATGSGSGSGNAGIRVESDDNSILNNTASNNLNDGIYLNYSSGNVLTDNIANSNNVVGIRLHSSGNNTLARSTANLNKQYGIVLDSSSSNTLSSNTASSNIMYGIYTSSSSDNTLTGNTCSDNQYGGVYLQSSNHNKLAGNNASDNSGTYYSYGIYLYSSSNNTLTNNIASRNKYGIYMNYLSNNNTLTTNMCADNNYGIYINIYYYYSSTNNHLYHNNLINNTNSNAHDRYINTWDNDYPSGGNYYSDYDGADNDGDGIGNIMYSIPGGTSIDRFPLVQPWSEVPPQKGDLNRDNQITPADAAIALRIAASGAHDDAADVSGDGQVTSLDALMILQAAVGNVKI